MICSPPTRHFLHISSNHYLSSIFQSPFETSRHTKFRTSTTLSLRYDSLLHSISSVPPPSNISSAPISAPSPSCIPPRMTRAVPPVIEPFSFQDGLAEGMRTRTVCGVSSGDPPLSLHWLKDGEPLPLQLARNITSLDQYSSLLSIPSLSASHSGDYTCVASNPAAEIKFTAQLMVKGRRECARNVCALDVFLLCTILVWFFMSISLYICIIC